MGNPRKKRSTAELRLFRSTCSQLSSETLEILFLFNERVLFFDTDDHFFNPWPAHPQGRVFRVGAGTKGETRKFKRRIQIPTLLVAA